MRFVIRLQWQRKTFFFLDLEIQYRETLIEQSQRNHDEYQRLDEHHRRLIVECQYYTEEYSSEKLQHEYDYHQQLHTDYEKLQQDLSRCLTNLEQNEKLFQQIQKNVEQTQNDVEILQTTMKNEKKVSFQMNSFHSIHFQ